MPQISSAISPLQVSNYFSLGREGTGNVWSFGPENEGKLTLRIQTRFSIRFTIRFCPLPEFDCTELWYTNFSEGHLSFRNATHGSWFIRNLTDKIDKYGLKLEFHHVLLRVNAGIADIESQTGQGKLYTSKVANIFFHDKSVKLYKSWNIWQETGGSNSVTNDQGVILWRL